MTVNNLSPSLKVNVNGLPEIGSPSFLTLTVIFCSTFAVVVVSWVDCLAGVAGCAQAPKDSVNKAKANNFFIKSS